VPTFSARSLSRLETCHPDLVRLFRSVIEHVDCTVLEGVRSDERQAELFRQGKSKLDGVTQQSKHQVRADGYSHAVDVCPWPVDWSDRERFIHFAGIVLGHAQVLGIQIRLGADWNGDGEFTERFFDAPHFERAG